MINFPVMRTKRLTVQLKELSMLDAIGLASIPQHMGEEATTVFLKAAVAEVKGIEDPAQWTVQERTLAVCHYMASTLDDGPDFALAEGASHYSDYLMGDKDYGLEQVEIGEVEGDSWVVRHLTGAMAGAIERLQGEVPGITGRTHWQIGTMAAQMVPNGDAGDPGNEGEFDAFLLERMRVIANFPESVFVRLASAFEDANAQLAHLFNMAIDDDGFIALPREDSAAGKPPARFPVGACITELARFLGGKSQAVGA